MEWCLPWLCYGLAGAFAGLMSGILGIGGGVVVVPSLLYIFSFNPDIPYGISMHMAAGTSLAVMLLTSLASVRAHQKIEPIRWDVFHRLWPGIVLGTMTGAVLASVLPTQVLKVIFAVFLIFVAYKMLDHVHSTHKRSFPTEWKNRLVSFLIGLKSGLLGVGGGVLIIPYLTYCGVEQRRIAPISSLCTMTVAAVGTAMFMMLHHTLHGPDFSTGYVYWPAVLSVGLASVLVAPLGARLSYVVSVVLLRYVFVGILLLTALGLLL